MNKNVLIAFGGAVLIALLVAMLMSAMLKGGSKKEAQVVQETPRVQILVASKNLGVGQLLTAEDMKWKVWPEEAVFPGTIVRKGEQKAEEAAKGRLIRPIVMDEPILTPAIVGDAGGFLAATLEPGHRAIAIKVKAESMVAGFINPGDFVDVILTYRASVTAASQDPAIENAMQQVIERNLERYATETILQNVKVLGIDQQAVKDEKSGAKVGKTVTLEVDNRGAEVLALASQMGDISLSLRGLGDNAQVDPNGPIVTDARVTKITDEVFDELNAVAGGGTRRNDMRIYSGGAMTTSAPSAR